MAYPLTNVFLDANGHQVILSNNVLDVLTVDLAGSSFWSPTKEYSGYAANGRKYLLGERQELDIATWSSESEGLHRGPASEFPRRIFIILTDQEISIVDASDFTLLLRAIAAEVLLSGESVPGTFLEWSPDESVVLGSVIGIAGNTFSQVAWADGRLAVATDQGLRVLDFRADAAFAFTDAGEYRAGTVQSGLAYRNLQNYYGTTVYSPYGATSTQTVSARKLGTVSCYVFGTQSTTFGDGVTVFRWESSSIQRYFTTLSAVPIDSAILDNGVLVLLAVWDDGGTDRLRLIRNSDDWYESSDWTPATSDLPLQAGDSGRLTAFGESVLVAAGSGVWAIAAADIGGAVELRYGKTLTVDEGYEPTYEILTVSDSSVLDVTVDPSSGHIGILHGNFLDVVDPGTNTLEETYSTATFPALPAVPRVVHSFSFAVPEVSP